MATAGPAFEAITAGVRVTVRAFYLDAAGFAPTSAPKHSRRAVAISR